jgi:hypothetical protein
MIVAWQQANRCRPRQGRFRRGKPRAPGDPAILRHSPALELARLWHGAIGTASTAARVDWLEHITDQQYLGKHMD